jgi:hypothetical protein
MAAYLIDRVSDADLALLDEANLAETRRWADESWLPQTVWPGTDMPLTSMSMPLQWDMPSDARPGSLPLLTVIPPSYWEGRS